MCGDNVFELLATSEIGQQFADSRQLFKTNEMTVIGRVRI